MANRTKSKLVNIKIGGERFQGKTCTRCEQPYLMSEFGPRGDATRCKRCRRQNNIDLRGVKKK